MLNGVAIVLSVSALTHTYVPFRKDVCYCYRVIACISAYICSFQDMLKMFATATGVIACISASYGHHCERQVVTAQVLKAVCQNA